MKPKLVDHKRKYTPADIRKDVKIDLGVDVNYMFAWRARKSIEIFDGYNGWIICKVTCVFVYDGYHLPGVSYTYEKEYE